MQIPVEATVAAPVDRVWRAYTTPEAIARWNAASDDRHTTAATADHAARAGPGSMRDLAACRLAGRARWALGRSRAARRPW